MKKLYKIRLAVALVVLLATILAVVGFYPFKFLDIEFTPLFQRAVYDYSIFAISLFVGLILFTIFFGRLYCSTLCPFGILQEVFAIIYSKIIKKKTFKTSKSYIFKYFISAITLGSLIAGSAILIRYIDPYTIFASFISLSIFGIIATIIVLALVFFKNRFFCTNICPVGAFLGLISKSSINKININDDCIKCHKCEKSCPSGSIDVENKTVDNETCVKCLKCISICPKSAIKYNNKPVQFSNNKRTFLTRLGILAFIGAGYAMGIRFSKTIASKVKNIILPAGAIDTNTMANKCLNCNLCINNCPNKILEKANDDFSTVHINYTKGEKYCKFDCNNCSKSCPSGAIKKISLEEKQKTRIAMAIIKDNCISCGNCAKACPKGAITLQEVGKPAILDASKCIGCNKCKTVCRIEAIDVVAINKQTEI